MKGCDMHKLKLAALMSAAGISFACATSAYAGFVNEAATESKQAPPAAAAPDVTAKPLPESPAVPQAVATGRKVTQVGLRPANVFSPRGKGVDIALADVLPVIVPRDYRLDIGSVNAQEAVSWIGGDTWDNVLATALTPVYGVEATINWDQKVVTLRNVAQRTNGVQQTNVVNAATVRSIAPQAVPMRWQVRFADVTLRQTLIRWAKDAGWQVSWDISNDFPVQMEGSFSGTFEDAVTQFAASLSGSDFPIMACLYDGNQAVRILRFGDKKECKL